MTRYLTPRRYFVTIGGLVSYGVDATDQYRRAASYADRILKVSPPTSVHVKVFGCRPVTEVAANSAA